MRTIAVIGGGASGMAAAITAKRENPSLNVVVFEHKDTPGKKILSTGNGRCNLTNEYMECSCFRSDTPAYIPEVLTQFGTNDTLQFFTELGLLTKSRNGYIYPRNDQASSVLELLKIKLRELGIEVKCNLHVTDIAITKKGFRIFTKEANYLADKVILATGSKAASVLGSDGSGYSFAKKLGHQIVPVVPALVQLKVNKHPFSKASGVRTDAKVSAFVDGRCVCEDTGELQITNYGISGIPVFQISRYIARALYEKKHAEVEIDFMPQLNDDELNYLFTERATVMKSLSVSEFLTGIFNQKLIPRLLELGKIKINAKVSELTSSQIKNLASICKHTKLSIIETNGFENAQICAGGVSLDEISIYSMESKINQGLYIVGELLDADGICGGYNLQWAWATGVIAGKHAAK